MAEAVGAVHIDISAETAKLQEGIKKAQNVLRQLGRNAERDGKLVGDIIGTMVATAGGLATAFIGVSSAFERFQRHIEDTTALDNLSQATGISVQRLQEFQNVAKIVGLEVSSLTQAATTFGARMTEAIGNPVGRTSQAMSALGISIREADGSIKSFETVLLEVAQRFPRYADGANKAAIAAAIFGEEAGPRLVPLLNRGRDGIQELQNKVRSAYRPEDVEAVRRYRQASAELGETIDRVLLPVLTAAVNALTAIVNVAGAAAEGIQKILPPSNTVKEKEQAIKFLNQQLDQYKQQLDKGVISAERFEFYQRRIKAQIDALRTSLQTVNSEWKTTVTEEPKPPAPTVDTSAIQGVRAELALYMAQLQNLQGLQEFQTQAFVEAWERQRAALIANHATTAEIAAARIGMLQQEFNTRNQLLADSMTAEEQFRQRETQLREAAMRGIITETELRKALAKQSLDQAQAAVSAIGQGLSAMSSAWPKIKAFAIAETIANGLAGAIRAYKDLPTWLAIPTAGMIMAATAKNVANIASTNPGSGAPGLSAPSAPSASATASEPVQATPSQSFTINLQGGRRYTDEEVAAIIEGINDRVQNGVTLVATRTAA